MTKQSDTYKKANLPFIFFIISVFIYCIALILRYTGFESQTMVVFVIALASSVVFGVFSIIYTVMVKENKYFVWAVLTIIMPIIFGFMNKILGLFV